MAAVCLRQAAIGAPSSLSLSPARDRSGPSCGALPPRSVSRGAPRVGVEVEGRGCVSRGAPGERGCTTRGAPRVGPWRAASRRSPSVRMQQAEGLGGFLKRFMPAEPEVVIPSPPAPAEAVAAPAAQSVSAPAAVEVERSYVMVKPDGVQRGLVGEIITRFERKGFVLRGLKLFQCPKDLAEEHYKDLSAKPFYPKLVEYIISGPVVAMAWEGTGVVASARKLIGATNPLTAEPGTIRGDFAVEVGRNVVHGSDSIDNGSREIALWFKEGELCDWEPVSTPWLRE